MDDSWRTPQMRQSVVAKLNDAIQASPGASKSAIEMESHVFAKAKTKEQYLGFVARLILHVREIGTNKQAQAAANAGDGNPDPINALQNLANQGSRPQNVMGGGGGVGGGGMVPQGVVGNNPNMQQTNLMQQQLNQQQQQQQQRNQVGMNNNSQQVVGQPGGVGPAMQGMQQQQQNRGPMQGNNMMGGGGMNPQGMMNQMQQQGQGQMMGQQMPGGVPMNQMNQMQQQQQMVGGQQMNQMGGGMNPNVVMNQMGGGVQGQGMVNMGPGGGMVGGQGMGGMNPMGGGGVNPGMNQGPGGVPMGQGMVGGPVAGGPGSMNQMQNSPAGAGGGGQGQGGQNQMNMMNQMQGMQRKQEMMMNSPGNMFSTNVRSVTPNQFLRENPSPSVPSPANMGNPQMIPSPAMAQSPSPQMINVNQRNMANVMAPSPGSVSLNTPGQPGTIPSPMNPQEDAMYKEKYRQLVKYIEPLKRMTAKMMHEKNTKAIHKINTLLEILSNHNQRIPYETLVKCEKALEQMNVGTPMGAASVKEGSTCNPLIEAVTANLQSPIRNHTLQRTFKPCLDALFGSDLMDMPSPAKQPRLSQEHHPVGSSSSTSATGSAQQEIPHILQGEIARLDQKFKITLDSSCQTGNKTIKLICCLDDKYLPCVPPVSVTIPEEYPMVAPSCNMTKHEYNATPFLTSVQVAFTARVSKLPRIFSLTHLLDTWEMSVRQACSPKKLNETTHCSLSVMLGV